MKVLNIKFLLLTIILGLSAKVYCQDIEMLFIVGEKITIKQKGSDKGGFKSVKAKYKVLKVIEGHFDGDIIEFLADPISLSESKDNVIPDKKR